MCPLRILTFSEAILPFGFLPRQEIWGHEEGGASEQREEGIEEVRHNSKVKVLEIEVFGQGSGVAVGQAVEVEVVELLEVVSSLVGVLRATEVYVEIEIAAILENQGDGVADDFRSFALILGHQLVGFGYDVD